MNELSIVERNAPNTRAGFWRRQVARDATRPQAVFDAAFGIVAPVLCFVFDPIVFRSGFVGPPLFPEYQTFVYLLSGLEIMVLCSWLLCGPAFRLWSGLIGGSLVLGGIFCVFVGLILLPFSVFGLMFGIGLFGFTPFLTAMVYLRNGRRAWQSRNKNGPAFLRAATLLLSLLLVLGLPGLLANRIHVFVNNSIDEIIKGDSQHAMAAAQGVKPLRYFAGSELDGLVQTYLAESDPSRKQLLKRCYEEITGGDIEFRGRILRD